MSSSTIKTEGWHAFLDLCRSCETSARLDELFELFLTPDERQQLAQRVRLTAALLAEELTQREIASTLQVSIAKITRGSNQLKQVAPPFKAHLKKVLNLDANASKKTSQPQQRQLIIDQKAR